MLKLGFKLTQMGTLFLLLNAAAPVYAKTDGMMGSQPLRYVSASENSQDAQSSIDGITASLSLAHREANADIFDNEFDGDSDVHHEPQIGKLSSDSLHNDGSTDYVFNQDEEVLPELPSDKSNLLDLLAVNPVPVARVSSHFGPRVMGPRNYHYGIDLAAPTGTPIYAAGDGVVTFAGSMGGYGRMIEVDHGNGFVTRYGHPSRIYVSVGDRVSKRQEIAAVGCAGRCTGPHLHYEVRKNGRPVNPAPFIARADAQK